MGYWVNTTYVNHPKASDVSDALVGLCRSEGMELSPTPPERTSMLIEPMQYDRALDNDLWGAAIFPGAASWTVIQTAPLELLADRAKGAASMRLSDLCKRLSASAFQLNVYDSTNVILVEVSAEGAVLLSGFNMQSQSPDPFQWYGERLSEEHFKAQFQHHPFQQLIADAVLGDEKAKRIASRFGGANAGFCSNSTSVDTLISHKPFTAPGGVVRYFLWPGRSRRRFSACDSWDEYRAAVDKKGPSHRYLGEESKSE